MISIRILILIETMDNKFLSTEREVFMNITTYINELISELQDLPSEDLEQIREYFEEMLLDRLENSESEEEIIKTIGTPKQAADKLKLEYEAYIERTPSNVEEPKERPTLKKEVFTKPKEKAFSSLPTSILVQAEVVRIIAMKAPIPYPEVEFEPIENVDDFSISTEHDCFKVLHRTRKHWFFVPFGFHKTRDLVLKIPEHFKGDLTLETSNASISFKDFESLNALFIKTSNSKVTVDNVSAKKMELYTSNSPIKANNIRGIDLTLKTSNSKLFVSEMDFSNEVNLTTSNASLEVLGLCGSIVKLRTSNGPIKGYMKGSIVDYNVTSHTSNASSTLPTHMNTGKDKSLNVHTSNGKIALTFEQDQ